MTPVDWYFARDNKQQGPISSVELKQLADTGKLRAEDLVWREGMGEWLPAAKVKGLFDEPPAPADPTTAVPPKPGPSSGAGSTFEASAAAFERSREGPRRHFFDKFLELARKQVTAPVVESTAVIFALGGHVGLYVAMGVLLVFDTIVAVKTSDYYMIPAALAWVAALVVLQYVARRMLGAIERLNRGTPGCMASTAFLDSSSLFLMVLGLTALVGLTLTALQTGTYSLILLAIGLFILAQYQAMLALNPETLNLTVQSETSAAEEEIGKLSFLANVVTRSIPVAFGAGVVLSTLGMLYACVLVFFPSLQPAKASAGLPGLSALSGLSGLSALSELGNLAGGQQGEGLGLPSELMAGLKLPSAGAPYQATAWAARIALVGSAALPYATYLAYFFLFLIIRINQAILSLSVHTGRIPEDKSAPKEEG